MPKQCQDKLGNEYEEIHQKKKIKYILQGNKHFLSFFSSAEYADLFDSWAVLVVTLMKVDTFHPPH